MGRLTPVEVQVAPGVMTEETARGAKGRYKDCDKIRFRQLLPEKLGGWVLSSLGLTDGDLELSISQSVGLSTTYIATAPSIPLATAVTCDDGDPVWLFGTSVNGGFGVNTINDAAALEGVFVFTLASSNTASLGDAFVIEFPDEYTGSDDVASQGTTGSEIIVMTTGVTTYLKAGAIIRIDTDSGVQFNKLAADILSGAVTLTLEDPLIDNVDNSGTNGVRIYAPESDIIDVAGNRAFVIRFLAAAMAASTTVRLTEALPADSNGLDMEIFPFELVACDGDQVATSSLAITPGAANANTDGSSFPDSLVVLPKFEQNQVSYDGFSRALHDWVDLDGEKWLAIGTDVKLYLVNNGSLFDITPIRETGALVNPFDTTVGSRSVTVNDTAHGGAVGNYVRFTGGSSIGGLDLNDEFNIKTVIDANSYTIQADFPATSLVTGGGGAVTFEYDIDIGESGNVTVQGWGTGPYGAGLYGHGSQVGGIAKRLRIWSLDNFGEDLLASPNGGALYHWDRTNGANARATLIANAPSTIQRMLLSSEARHIIAFGGGTGSSTSPGDPDKLFIRWASSENLNDWIPSSINTAGDLRLDVGSEILTAVESRGDIIVFTDESLHALQFIGSDLVFSIRHLGQSVSIIGPNAAVDVNGVVYFMGEDDFLMYDGVLSVMPCEVRNQVFDDLNTAQGTKVYCSVNKLFTEIWWFYPSNTSETNDRYVKYNYRDKVWDFGTMERTAFHDSSSFLDKKPYGVQAGNLYQHETGVDESDEFGNLVAMTSFLETWDIEVGADGQFLMHVGEMIPDFKILDGSIDLTLKGRGYPARSEISTGPFTVTSATEKVDLRFRSRQVSFRVESDALSDDWRMSTWRIGARPHGRRGG